MQSAAIPVASIASSAGSAPAADLKEPFAKTLVDAHATAGRAKESGDKPTSTLARRGASSSPAERVAAQTQVVLAPLPTPAVTPPILALPGSGAREGVPCGAASPGETSVALDPALRAREQQPEHARGSQDLRQAASVTALAEADGKAVEALKAAEPLPVEQTPSKAGLTPLNTVHAASVPQLPLNAAALPELATGLVEGKTSPTAASRANEATPKAGTALVQAAKQSAPTSASAKSAAQDANAGSGQNPDPGAAAIVTKAAPGSTADAVSGAVSTFTLGAAAPEAAPANTAARATPSVGHDSVEVDPPATSSSISPIHAASVVESMQGSEMRVGVRTSEFGNVSVSTMVNREQIAAQISFDHGDLGKLLAAHLPTIEEKLGTDTGLHATVQVLDRGASYNQSNESNQGNQSNPGNDGSQGSNAGSQFGSGGQPASGGQGAGQSGSRTGSYGLSPVPPGLSREPSLTERISAESATRLDVRV